MKEDTKGSTLYLLDAPEPLPPLPATPTPKQCGMGNFIHEVNGIKKKKKKGKKKRQRLEVIHSSSHFGDRRAGHGREQWRFCERNKIVILTTMEQVNALLSASDWKAVWTFSHCATILETHKISVNVRRIRFS